MSAELDRVADERNDDFLQYRALSPLAVAGMIFALLSPLAFFSWFWAFIPATGVLLALLAARKIARHPDELSGKGLAHLALALSGLFLLAGPSYVTYEYVHEVPDGSDRISYEELQPEVNAPGQTVPPTAMGLDGKRVFIKGYIYPGAKKEGIKTFLLVRDQGDCCFGGDPKVTDRIQITLNDPLRLRYDQRLHGVAGVFHIQPDKAVDSVGGVLYQLEADYLH